MTCVLWALCCLVMMWISFDKLRWNEIWDEMRWDEMRWDEMRRDEMRYEMRWDEMRWDEMRWDEMRWDEMRWDEMRWDEMRYEVKSFVCFFVFDGNEGVNREEKEFLLHCVGLVFCLFGALSWLGLRRIDGSDEFLKERDLLFLGPRAGHSRRQRVPHLLSDRIVVALVVLTAAATAASSIVILRVEGISWFLFPLRLQVDQIGVCLILVHKIQLLSKNARSMWAKRQTKMDSLALSKLPSSVSTLRVCRRLRLSRTRSRKECPFRSPRLVGKSAIW